MLNWAIEHKKSDFFFSSLNICKWCFPFWLLVPLVLLLLQLVLHDARFSFYSVFSFNLAMTTMTKRQLWLGTRGNILCCMLVENKKKNLKTHVQNIMTMSMITFAYFISMLHNQREFEIFNTLAHIHTCTRERTCLKWNLYLEGRKRWKWS